MQDNPFRLDGKTIAMTGAAGILGQAAVAAFLQAGARVCALDRSTADLDRLGADGDRLLKIVTDVSDAASVKAAAARLHATSTATMIRQRLADLTRALHKLHWEGRKQFLQMYLGMTGRRLQWKFLWPFYVYDSKVWLKRTIGRKGMRKLLRYIKSRVS